MARIRKLFFLSCDNKPEFGLQSLFYVVNSLIRFGCGGLDFELVSWCVRSEELPLNGSNNYMVFFCGAKSVSEHWLKSTRYLMKLDRLSALERMTDLDDKSRGLLVNEDPVRCIQWFRPFCFDVATLAGLLRDLCYDTCMPDVDIAATLDLLPMWCLPVDKYTVPVDLSSVVMIIFIILLKILDVVSWLLTVVKSSFLPPSSQISFNHFLFVLPFF